MALLKKIILVVGPLVFIGMLLYVTMGSGPKMPDGMMLVDMRTGEIERFDYDDVKFIPWMSREDGKRVMVPVVQDEEDGPWRINPRYVESVKVYYEENGDTGAIDLEQDGLVVNPVGP